MRFQSPYATPQKQNIQHFAPNQLRSIFNQDNLSPLRQSNTDNLKTPKQKRARSDLEDFGNSPPNSKISCSKDEWNNNSSVKKLKNQKLNWEQIKKSPII